MLEVEWWLLRVCCYDDVRIKIYVVKIYIRSNNSGKEISSKHVVREEVIKTKLTAVKLLTKQELKKIGSVAQRFYEHAATHKYKYWDNKYIRDVYKENGKKTGS